MDREAFRDEEASMDGEAIKLEDGEAVIDGNIP